MKLSSTGSEGQPEDNQAHDKVRRVVHCSNPLGGEVTNMPRSISSNVSCGGYLQFRGRQKEIIRILIPQTKFNSPAELARCFCQAGGFNLVGGSVSVPFVFLCVVRFYNLIS